MRQLAVKNLTHLSPPIPPKEPQVFSQEPPNYRWRPYSNSNSCAANVAIVVIIMTSFAICAMSLAFAIRCFLRGEDTAAHRQPHQRPSVNTAATMLVAVPTLTYSGRLKLAGAERECKICLSEFEEGDQVKVLPICNHGFHVRCLEQWLPSHFSCPLCRTNVLVSSIVAVQAADSNSQAAIATPGNHAADAA